MKSQLKTGYEKNTSYTTFTPIFIKNKHKTHEIKDNANY